MMLKISIIIPIYNTSKTIKHCLDYLINQNYDLDKYEIILINDGSTDDTENIIKPYLKNNNITFIKLYKNFGPSKARNTGAAQAKYDILAFIDSDAYADKNWLTNISSAFTNDNVLACGGMIDNYNNGFFSNINHICQFSEYYSSYKKEVRFAPAANFAINKKIFNKLGGFDEKLNTGEDLDINYRFIKLGYNLYYYPNIIIKHDTSNNFFIGIKKLYGYGLGDYKFKIKHSLNKKLSSNKFKITYIILRTMLFEIILYNNIKRGYIQKYKLIRTIGLPFLIILRITFRFGFYRNLLLYNK